MSLLEVERQLCQGLVRLLLGIKMTGIVEEEPPFNTEAERFNQRFGAFAQLETPEALDYTSFLLNTNPSGATANKVKYVSHIETPVVTRL